MTDVFLDFDGTLSVSNSRGIDDYVIPLLERMNDMRVTDDVDLVETEGATTWARLDLEMSHHVCQAAIDMSDHSLLGPRELRKNLNDNLRLLSNLGFRIHLLTMGTPHTQKALLEAAGYDVNLFCSWLGPADMARNQGLKYLFDNGDVEGSEASVHCEFMLKEDLEDIKQFRVTGAVGPVLTRIRTMEKRLSKAALILEIAGEGGLLVDDSWTNVYDASSKGVMYMHVDPEGVDQTSKLIATLISSGH